MVITVEAGPSDLGWEKKIFNSYAEYTDWLNEYVCGACKVELEEEYGPGPWDEDHILSTGCGCEIWVETD